MNIKLIELLKIEGRALADEFKKASVSGRGTPQEIADFREAAFRPFVGRFFPFPYRVTKGIITDSYGGESASIDCVLIHPRHPHTVDRADKFTVIMVDGVQAAIEIKPNLQDHAELIRGLEQIRTVKKLSRQRSGLLRTSVAPPSQDLIEDSKRVPSFLYAEYVKSDPLDTAREIAAFYVQNAVPPHEQLDFVAVNGVGIISNFKFPSRCEWAGGPGLYWEQWNDLTIAALLWYLNWVFSPEAPIMEPLLRSYLRGIGPERVIKVHSWPGAAA